MPGRQAAIHVGKIHTICARLPAWDVFVVPGAAAKISEPTTTLLLMLLLIVR